MRGYLRAVRATIQLVPVDDIWHDPIVPREQQELGDVGPVESIGRGAHNDWVWVRGAKHSDCSAPELQEVCVWQALCEVADCPWRPEDTTWGPIRLVWRGRTRRHAHNKATATAGAVIAWHWDALQMSHHI